MDVVGCYNLLVSCVISFNTFSNSSKCSDMEKAIECGRSEPNTCNHMLIRKEMELLGFMVTPQDQHVPRHEESFPAREPRRRIKRHNDEKHSVKSAGNYKGGDTIRNHQIERRETKDLRYGNVEGGFAHSGSKSRVERQTSNTKKRDVKETKNNTAADIELYQSMYIILTLLDQAKQEYNDDCKEVDLTNEGSVNKKISLKTCRQSLECATYSIVCQNKIKEIH